MSDTHKHAMEQTEKSDAARREEEVLAFWNEHDIFEKSVAKDAPNGEFVFYDGPPFATGLPHYGHILAGTIKDAIPRFWTMNGYRVKRRWGWDCHGLPLENIIEKELGLATKRDIEEYGIQNFNEKARKAVMRYADDWRRIIPRMGRFVDMDDDYKTMDASYTESVWWVFKELDNKGLVYEGFKSMHLCPRCGTTLSNFEVNQGYKDIKDIAVTVKLPLVSEPDTALLVWTTTPWTLPANMAAAVHKDAAYVKVRVDGEVVVLAKERLSQLNTDEYEVLDECKGEQLIGKEYVPPFDYFQGRDFENKKNAWRIYHADYVDVENEGTGAVHLAPAYGEDDLNLALEHNIPIVHHVGEDGRFKEVIEDFSGQLVKPKDDDAGVSHLDADIEIVKALNERGTLFRKENVTHSYPHCWRCDTPLLNYATTSWFVRVTDIKDKLVSENEQIHWVPEHVGKNRFGKWLEGARDWAVSRQRYWGAPLPVWRNPETKEYTILGSLDELKSYVPKSGNQYLVMRHGEAQSNTTGNINAVPDEDNTLTDQGREQSTAAAEELKGKDIDLIVHSGMPRTRDTALLIAEALGTSPDCVLADERITELQVGEALEGKSWSDYEALYENYEEKFTKHIEGVENRYDVQKRVGAFLYELERTHKDKTILVVGHAASAFALQAVAEGADMERAIAIREEGYLKNAEIAELPFTPLPHNDNYELDFHRPFIDEIELFDGETKLERVPDVFDCWFESGSMPYGQHHYPFENTDVFDPKKGKGYPAQFIAESIDQTRGWFYSLIVLGTALFKQAPYQNVITNGLVLAEDGKKMSKSLQNYPDPMELVERQGADTMRYYLLSSSIIRGEDLNFSEKEVAELQRKNIGRLHNVLLMYEMYADDTAPVADSPHILDRWMVARMHETAAEITEGFREYKLDRATRPLTDLIDDLSVWYLRRSRDRLKGGDEEDKQRALATLRYVLRSIALVMAPPMPFYAEHLWQRVRTSDDPESVHLADWPSAPEVDQTVLDQMASVRRIVVAAHDARTKAGIKVRQPLRALSVQDPALSNNPELLALVRDEVNVKGVVFDASLSDLVALDTTITPELKDEGSAREFMRAVQDMRKKRGLAPEDRIMLRVSCEGCGYLRTFEDDILKVVGAEAIEPGGTDGETITVDGEVLQVSIEKK